VSGTAAGQNQTVDRLSNTGQSAKLLLGYPGKEAMSTSQMTEEDLHLLLTSFGLVPEPVRRADSCTYFLGKIQRHPEESTRTIRVFYSPAGQPLQLQLCASSDNNNTVLLHQPFESGALMSALKHEIALVTQRIGTRQ